MINDNNQKGFTLVELLIALAIGAIIIGAAFGSYMIVARNYEFQKDMKYISQSAHAVVKLIRNDIRMAGYKDDTSPTISNALTITDSGADCCDSVEIVYDKSATDRHWIRYWTEAYPASQTDRYRLYKRIRKCTDAACTTFASPDVLPQNPIADYVEDLQLVGTKGDCVAGAQSIGCGTQGEITATIGGGSDEPVEAWQSGTCCSTSYLIDGNDTTYWKNANGRVQFNFSDPVRIKYVMISHPGPALHPGLDNGGAGPADVNTPVYNNPQMDSVPNFFSYHYPYGFNYSTVAQTTWHVITNECTSSSNRYPDCKTVGAGDSNLSGGSIGEMYGGYIYALNHTQQWSLGMQALTQQVELELGDREQYPIYGNPTFPCWQNFTYVPSCDGFNVSGVTSQSDVGSPVVAEVRFYGETYGGAIKTQEVEISVLLRSPNEHGTVDRANNWNSKVDKYLRDNYTTSTVIRNLFYQSQ